MSWLLDFFWRLFSSDGREERAEKELAFRYTAPDRETVSIPRFIEPYTFLNVRLNASRAEIKSAFLRVANHSSRHCRAMASLSYHILMSKDQRYRKISNASYEVSSENDVIVLAAVGDTASLIDEISKDPSLVTSTDEHEHSLLYLTARAGFYDTTEALLEKGVPVNETQVDGSTALHAASYFEQLRVVKLLLRYGADPEVNNRWDKPPADEASTKIKRIILSYKEDPISKILATLLREGLACRVRFVKHKDTVIAKEVLRHRNAIDGETRQQLDPIISTWKNVWHGTRAEHLESIMRHGLKPSGSTLPDGRSISPPSGHFKLGKKYFGTSDWARAIFVSPRITYASHEAYSERVFSDNKQWCILIRARVKLDSYTRHKSTVNTEFHLLAGESALPEYRVANSEAAGMFSQANSEEEAEIFGILSETETVTEIELGRNVVVTSVVFISEAFLKETDRTFQEVMSLFDKEHFS